MSAGKGSGKKLVNHDVSKYLKQAMCKLINKLWVEGLNTQ